VKRLDKGEVGGLVSDRTQRAVQDFTAWNTIVRAFETIDALCARELAPGDRERLANALDIAEVFREETRDEKRLRLPTDSLVKRALACHLITR
jgi:hypothetical protein